MKLSVTRQFEKDILAINDKKLAVQLQKVIASLEQSKALTELSQVKKMKSDGEYYRIRLGDYRLGFEKKNNTIQLQRFMHRKEIYCNFP